MFENILKLVERVIIIAMVIFMAIVLIVATGEIAVVMYKGLVSPSPEAGMILDVNELVHIFGFFLNVLIGLELFETVKLYLKENVFHGEVILLVSLIAVARKVIVLDYKNTEPLTIIAVAILIGTISGGYYLLKKSLRDNKDIS